MINTRTFLNKPDGITVLSVFDGMSCGQLALQKLGVKVKQYYASEIERIVICNTLSATRKWNWC